MPFTPDVHTRTSALPLDVSRPPEVFEVQDVSTGMKFNMCHASTMERYKAERDALQQLLNARDEEVDKLRALAKKARNELQAIKAAVGFRAETLQVIGALDMAPENQA